MLAWLYFVSMCVYTGRALLSWLTNTAPPILLELSLCKPMNEVLQKYLVCLLPYFQLSNIFEYLEGDYTITLGCQ